MRVSAQVCAHTLTFACAPTPTKDEKWNQRRFLRPVSFYLNVVKTSRMGFILIVVERWLQKATIPCNLDRKHKARQVWKREC